MQEEARNRINKKKQEEIACLCLSRLHLFSVPVHVCFSRLHFFLPRNACFFGPFGVFFVPFAIFFVSFEFVLSLFVFFVP